jgi:hypothetical protein
MRANVLVTLAFTVGIAVPCKDDRRHLAYGLPGSVRDLLCPFGPRLNRFLQCYARLTLSMVAPLTYVICPARPTCSPSGSTGTASDKERADPPMRLPCAKRTW